MVSIFWVVVSVGGWWWTVVGSGVVYINLQVINFCIESKYFVTRKFI